MITRKTFAGLAALALLTLFSCFVLPAEATAQMFSTPPTYCCGPSYTFGEAKAHNHTQLVTGTGFFRGNGLVDDPTNTGGNNFLGNTIRIGFASQKRNRIYWFDWSADPQAVRKLAVWGSQMWEPITYTYDPECMLIVSATSPRIPPGPFVASIPSIIVSILKPEPAPAAMPRPVSKRSRREIQ